MKNEWIISPKYLEDGDYWVLDRNGKMVVCSVQANWVYRVDRLGMGTIDLGIAYLKIMRPIVPFIEEQNENTV